MMHETFFLASNIPELKSYQCIRIPINDLEGEVDPNRWFVGLLYDFYRRIKLKITYLGKIIPDQKCDEHNVL